MQTLPMQVQGRARAMSIVLVLPLALACAGGFLYLAQGVENPSWFLVPGMMAAFVYLYFNRRMNHAYSEEIVNNLKQRLFVPGDRLSDLHEAHDVGLIKDLEQGVMSDDDDVSLAYARVLCKTSPEEAAELIPRRMSTASIMARDQMIKMLQPLRSSAVCAQLRQYLGKGDAHLDATLYKALIEVRDEQVHSVVGDLLTHVSQRIQAVGVYAAFHYPVLELQEQARQVWLNLLNDQNPEGFIPGIELIRHGMEQYYLEDPVSSAIQQDVVQLLNQEDVRFICMALDILSAWPTDDFKAAEQSIAALASHPDWRVRKDSLRASHIVPSEVRERLLLDALEDGHPQVRVTACECMVVGKGDPVAYFQDLLINHQLGSPRARQAMLEYLIQIGTDPQTMARISLALAREASMMNEAHMY
jgi:HEAT repeat protein